VKESIKILHLISSLTRGGRERQLATIVSNTDYEKFRTIIVYFNKHKHSYIEEYGLYDIAINIESDGLLKRLRELNLILKKEKPDIVYTWGNGESVSTLLLKPFHNFKFINGSVRHGIRLKKLSHYFRNLVLHISQNIVANSYAGLIANNLNHGYVLYNGITPKFAIHFNKQEKLDRRNTVLNIIENKILLISVANMVPYKDYFTVLEALKRLKEENYLFHYFILGTGPQRGLIEEKIKEYDLTDNINIIGNVENVEYYLKMADLFIHSSRGEGCSNAILEAMYAGLPVIATNVGGIPEIVYPKSSLLFPYRDHHALYRCLLNAKALQASFNPESKEYREHLEKFSVNTMLNKFEEIIYKVIYYGNKMACKN